MSNLPYVLDGRYTQGHPLDMEDARMAARALAQMRHDVRKKLDDAVETLSTAHEELAEAERLYRQAKSEAWITAAVQDVKLADHKKDKIDSDTAPKRQTRDVKKGVVVVQKQRIAKIHAELSEVDGDRASFHRLVEWSMRLDAFAQEQRGGTR